MRKRKRKGFTIIELVVVAVIIGMLAVFVVPNIGRKFGKAKSNIAKGKIGIIGGAISEFQMDCGRIPTEMDGLEALLTGPDDLEGKWDGPYAKESELIDPWGNPYLYIEDDTNRDGYILMSYGADGEEGGEGENKDILND
jgi:general secretion pathway protein G